MGNKPSKYMNNNKYVVIAALLAVILFITAFFTSNWLYHDSFLINLLVCAVIGLGVYVAALLIFKPTRKIGGVSVDMVKNGEEVMQILTHSYDDMNKIEHEISIIREQNMYTKAKSVFEAAAEIIKYIEKYPEKIAQARRFFTYYLDVTFKILNKYNDFSATRLETEEMKTVIEKTEKSMQILRQTYEQQLTQLMQNDVMDIEADVSLLESMLKSEQKN